jgi:CheY-like chemotaxis protein
MKTIVIVEDHPVLISIYRNKFLAAGFQVEIASDGESGLELINRIRPDLIMLDLAMPKLNGIEVLKRVRANPLFQSTPVVVFSDSAWTQQAWREGATLVLSKSGHSPSEVVEFGLGALQAAEGRPLEASLATNLAFLADGLVSSKVAPENSAPQGHVLLVEDHNEVRTTISAALELAGFEVTGAASHATALDQTAVREFDAYLLNRICPDGLGLALSRQLRQRYPLTPIVLYSTLALPITAEQRLTAGATAYLTEAGDILKPGGILVQLIAEAKTALSYA